MSDMTTTYRTRETQAGYAVERCRGARPAGYAEFTCETDRDEALARLTATAHAQDDDDAIETPEQTERAYLWTDDDDE